MTRHLLMIPIVLIVLASPASAGFFSKKPKPNPAERVPELLTQLKIGTDESKRQEAADELKQYDPKSFPEIVPALIDALGKDASTGVRSEAASTIAKLRPISQPAGYALEQAQNNDPSMRVRISARQALLQYNLVGYRGGKPPEPAANKADATQTPPATQPATAVRSQPPSLGKTAQARGPYPETAEPPLADPLPTVQAQTIPVARPRTPTPLQPVAMPKLQPLPGGPPPIEVPSVPKPPTKSADTDGPSLSLPS